MRQPKWDKFEAALLIETYWNIRNGKISRKEAVASLSKLLRDRVPENEIDETYRNENGINMRLGELDALFNDGKGGLTNTSELFREMVSMYNTDQNAFEEILKEAHDMNGNTSIKASFKTWLSAKYPKAVFDVVCSYIKTAEEFCVKVKVLKQPLLETVEAEVLKRVYKTITENKIFRIVNNPQTDKNGQITELGQKLMALGVYHPFTWAAIWTNLAYNSSLIKWYLLCVDKGETYEKGDFVFLIGDDYSERQRENAVSSLCETLGKSPIGNTLEMGIPIPNGNTYKYHKKGWSTPDGPAILFALYKYAEKLNGHYSMTLKELQSIRDNRPDDFIGMDPVTIFALDEAAFKDMLRQLANDYPDFIKIAFVADLDNVTLNSEKTSLDVVDLVLGGN